jgi:SpoVK/Ycf46/Vps4 family AAA+-type ATPase
LEQSKSLKRAGTITNQPAAVPGGQMNNRPSLQVSHSMVNPRPSQAKPTVATMSADKRMTLSKLDQEMVKSIMENVVEKGPGVKWTDIEGLTEVKQAL